MVVLATVLYPHTCTIERVTNSSDALNRPTKTWETSDDEVPCRFDDSIKQEITADLQVVVAGPRIYFGPLVDIINADRVTTVEHATSGKSFPGTFGVVSVRDPGGEGHHLEVEVEQVSGIS